jgi:hypothetical protein
MDSRILWCYGRYYWFSLIEYLSIQELLGTIVATLQQPIGEYFQQSHKASYIGTSYLLSICCFTPLYGKYILLPMMSAQVSVGRLCDIIGRKSAMVSTSCKDEDLLLILYSCWGCHCLQLVHYYAGWLQLWERCSLRGRFPVWEVEGLFPLINCEPLADISQCHDRSASLQRTRI